MKLRIDNAYHVTKPDFQNKFPFKGKSAKTAEQLKKQPCPLQLPENSELVDHSGDGATRKTRWRKHFDGKLPF